MTLDRPARTAKIGMTACLAAFAFLVCLNNLTDYGDNFAFVRHVLSMDSVFADNRLLWRAVTVPWAWHAAYLSIIAAEGLTGALFACATWQMLRQRTAAAAQFAAAKRCVHYGLLVGFLLWFLGFAVIGGEWFTMWQSRIWNGQEPAFRFCLTLIAVGLYINQPD